MLKKMVGPAQVAPHKNFERQPVTLLYAGCILKDAKTADLPVMQSTKLELHRSIDRRGA
jgi:hypothetical protein